jgi:hypothetical protein
VTTWTSDELSRVGDADEIRIASRRRDGTLRDPVTTWVVRHGDDLYVRSVNGRAGAWFRGAQARHEGRVSAGGVDQEITLAEVDDDLDDDLDAAYRAKYRRYPAAIVGHVVSPKARAATLRLVPSSTSS